MSYSLNLNQQGFKQNSLITTDGVAWPNFGIEIGGNLNLDSTLTSSSTLYTYFKIGNAFNFIAGTRYTFCIQRQTSNIKNIYLLFTSTQPPASSATLAGITGSTNYYYSSIDNKYYTNSAGGTTPALYKYPTIDVDGGQIYVRIEEDGKIYSGYGKQTASLIGTIAGTKYIGIVTFDKTSGVSGSGTYKFIKHTVDDPAPTAPPVTYNSSILKLPNNSTTQTFTTTTTNKYYFNFNTAGNNFTANLWGNDRYYLLGMTYNGNRVKIGFYMNYADPLITNQRQFESNSSVHLPYFYYDSFNGQCVIGTTVLATLAANLSTLFIRMDENYNFYVGTSVSSNTLIGNYRSYVYSGPKAIDPLAFGLEIFTSSSINTTIDLLDSGYKTPSYLTTTGYTWPNFYERPQNAPNSLYSYQMTYVLLTSSDYEPFSGIRFFGNVIHPRTTRRSCTIKCITGGMTEWTLLFGSITSFPNTSPTYSTFTGTEYVYYTSNGNACYKTGGILVGNLSPSPNITTTNGQIYFRTEEDGSIYIGRDAASAVLVFTFPLSVTNFHSYLVLKGPTSGTYRFIENN